MADDDDLEYSETNVGSAQSQGVRKNISLKLKGKGRGGRGRKSVRGKRSATSKKVTSGEDEDQARTVEDLISEETPPEKQISDSNLDEMISKLETPSFNPMERVFPEPLHQNKKLRWNHKVNLIGEKVINPLIHCCEKCSLPILNYGRLIPCKHVFCYECAKKAEKSCPKCEDKIQRVEQTALGTVFMCTFGGSRLGPVSCGRTYLSQRDLQAHINHRHLKPPPAVSTTAVVSSAQNSISHNSTSTVPANVNLVPTHPRDPRGHVHEMLTVQAPIGGHVSHGHAEHRDQGDHSRTAAVPPSALPSSNQAGQPRQYPHSPASYPSAIPVSSARPNLITVPIQDDSSSTNQHSTHPQSHSQQQYSPVSGTAAHSLAPVQQTHAPGSYPPPPHAYQHPIGPAAPAYSQAPPVTTQTFSAHPPPVHHPPPPPIHGASVPMYSTPPPPVHHPPQTTYSTPPAAPPHTMPPQRFPGGAANYDEGSYLPPWNSGAVPPARAPMPPPRPLAAPPPSSNHNLGHIPARGPTDQGYRPPYYQ